MSGLALFDLSLPANHSPSSTESGARSIVPLSTPTHLHGAMLQPGSAMASADDLELNSGDESVDVLTRDEAEWRASIVISPVHYTLAIELADSTKSSTFGGTVLIEYSCRPASASAAQADSPALFLDFCFDVHEATLNGVAVTSDLVQANSRLTLPPSAALPGLHVLELVFTGSFVNDGDGFHRYVDPVDGRVYVYSNFEPFCAHLLFPCFDQPDIKATYTLQASAPPDWTVISNELTLGEPEELAATERRPAAKLWRFARTLPFSTYLFALIAGPYVGFHDRHEGFRDLPLALYCRQSMAQYVDAPEIFAVMKAGLLYFSAFFEFPYAFSKYDHIYVPEFNVGAMENVAAVTFSENDLFREAPTEYERACRCDTILHEMAHHWFGNVATMRFWGDLWLNESFASYVSSLAGSVCTRFGPLMWLQFHSEMKSWGIATDLRESTNHPIASDVRNTDETFLRFDGITYGKGASWLKQAVASLGMDVLQRGMALYFQRFAWANTTLADFLACLGEAAGRDLGPWAASWLETKGVNVLAMSRNASGMPCMEQLGSVLREHTLVTRMWRSADRADFVDVSVTLQAGGVRGPLALASAGLAEPPLFVLPDVHDDAFAIFHLDEASLAAVRSGLALGRLLGGMDACLPRMLVWRSLAALVKSGSRAFTSLDFVQLVSAQIRADSSLEVIGIVLLEAAVMLAKYMPSLALASAWRSVLFGVCMAQARLFSAASPERLVWLRGATYFGGSTRGVAVLMAMRDVLDQDMRWDVLELYAIYRSPPDAAAVAAELAAELGRDSSDRGLRAAERIRAAIPLADVKLATWARLLSDRTSSMHMLRAAMGGLVAGRSTHEALLASYQSRMYSELDALLRSRSNDFAETALTTLFPLTIFDGLAEHVTATEAFLAGLPVDFKAAQVVRHTLEGLLDDARRIMLVRAAAAEAGAPRAAAGRLDH